MMFKNIGEKMKTLAKVICWMGIIASVIGGVSMMVDCATEITVLLGLLIIELGSMISWVSSLGVYALGEIVLKLTEIAENTLSVPNVVESVGNTQVKKEIKSKTEGV